ncbi:hypothetical protein [Brachybacterium muris]|uniref:hypothetical protein n=1 Tax=Brachybacterium muris TaxID=219301 RepID=UPI0012373967|nr:hypothetical protein [Brachybacterium muris]
MSEPSSQAGAGDPRPSQQPPRPATPGVRVNSPHVIPQGPAPEGPSPSTTLPSRPAAPPASQPPAHRPSAAPTAATADAGRSAPPSDDLFAPAPAGRNKEDSPNRTRNLLACGGCLLLALLLAAGLFLGYQWITPDEGSYKHPETPTAEQSEAPAEEEQPTEGEPAEEVSPAPEGAQELSALVSPSGNIHCTLSGDDVSCSLEEHFLENNTGGECTEDAPFAVRVGAEGEPQLDCGQSVASGDATELAYGASAKNGNVACTSESSGMTCWNTRTGKGFTVAKDTYETF